MITNGQMSWFLIKFSQQVTKEIGKIVGRIWMLILELKGLIWKTNRESCNWHGNHPIVQTMDNNSRNKFLAWVNPLLSSFRYHSSNKKNLSTIPFLTIFLLLSSSSKIDFVLFCIASLLGGCLAEMSIFRLLTPPPPKKAHLITLSGHICYSPATDDCMPITKRILAFPFIGRVSLSAGYHAQQR